MRANLDCIPCLMRQALEAARKATDDERQQETILREVSKLMGSLPYSHTPPEIAHRVHAIVRDVTGNPDPYRQIKEADNKRALEMYPLLKELVVKSGDRLHTAVKLAAAGNIIDYGVSHEFDIGETVENVLNMDFSVDRYPKFRKDLAAAGNITYLADNAGELVFDKLLIEELGDRKITLVVKGGPIINDATADDVKQCGLEGLVTVERMGNGTAATGHDRSDPEFLSKLAEADLVISKGQGNYEGLNGEAYIYFLLMAKCPLIAQNIGVECGSIVFCGGETG
jgi:damage-control phosphatase, subfamily I